MNTSKLIKLKSIYDLKVLLVALKAKFNKLEYDINNPEEIVLDKCLEYRRIIQLEKKELMANLSILDSSIMNQISQLNNEYDQLIDKINNYEKDIISHLKLVKNDEKFRNEFNKFKQMAHNWLTKSCICQIRRESKLKFAENELNSFNKKLNGTIQEMKSFLYNEKSIVLRKLNTGLVYDVYWKDAIDNFSNNLLISKCKTLPSLDSFYVALKKLLQVEQKIKFEIQSIDLFDDGKYLLLTNGSLLYAIFIQKLIIYDHQKRKIKKIASLKGYFNCEVRIANNSIVVAGLKSTWYILIFDFNLRLISSCESLSNFVCLSHCKPSLFFCELYSDRTIRILDSSFNVILDSKQYRTNNLSQLLCFNNCNYQFEYFNDKFYFKDCSDHSEIVILDSNGFLLVNKIKINNSYDLFNFDYLNGNIVVYNTHDNRVNIFDENGIETKEIRLIKMNMFLKLDSNRIILLIDHKSRYVLFDKDSNKFCYLITEYTFRTLRD